MENRLKKLAISGTVWKFLERIIAQGVTFVVSVIIARILDPSDYSVVGLVTIFFAFANVIISGGLNTALIQKKDSKPEDYSSVLFISVGISVLVYIILFLLSPWLSVVFNHPTLVPIIRIMGLILPVSAVKSIWCAYISSQLLFRKFFFATLGGTIASAFVGITLAINGYGVWSIVIQQMTNTAVDTVILIVCTRVPITLSVSFNTLKQLFAFGWKVLASSLIATIYIEISPLVIGLKYTDSDLAFYTKGKSFPGVISSSTTNTLSAVLFPLLSRKQDDIKMVLGYTRRFVQLSSYIVFPIMLGLFAIADNFVLVLLTEKWFSSVYYIRLFSICYMFDVVAVGNCETIKAIGRSDVYLIMEVIKKTLYIAVIFIFIVFSDSPKILALSSLVCVIIQIIVNSIPNHKLIGYRFIDQIKDMLPNLVASLLMSILVLLVGRIEMNLILKLIIQVILGGLIYIIISILTHNNSFCYVRKAIRQFER